MYHIHLYLFSCFVCFGFVRMGFLVRDATFCLFCFALVEALSQVWGYTYIRTEATPPSLLSRPLVNSYRTDPYIHLYLSLDRSFSLTMSLVPSSVAS